MTNLKIHLLGPPRIEQTHGVVDIQRRKAQALLFYLAITGEAQPRETLTTLLWPEHDSVRGRDALRRHLSELNAALGGGWISTDRATVALMRPAEVWVDVQAFAQLLAVCQTHDHAANHVCPACIPPLTSAVALYRADFLAGFTLPDAPAFDEWHFFQGEELRQSLAMALERLIQAHVSNDDAAAAIPHARRYVNLDPLHEAAHRHLMRLYAATNQLSAALRQYELCVQTLHDELDVAPAAETSALYAQLRQDAVIARAGAIPHRSASDAMMRHNLPAATTPFIGRVKERAALTRLCQDATHRLITILGAGGIGKTRLALEVAAQLAGVTSQGLFFVRLAQLNDPADIVQAIATAMNLQFYADGRSPKQQLVAYLQSRQTFLILDNFEHLLEGADLVQELLQSCPTLRLLVTSRERLQLTGETVFLLGTLDFPTWELPQAVQGYEAVQLFVETAQRIRPHGTLHEDEMLYIARICRLVGGMPLGIILAASWVEVLSPAEIAVELTQGFDLLATELRDLPERQRSMRAVIAYSWQRLTEAEQHVFARLALFRGGFTRAAAEEIAGTSLPTLARLVDKSFVQRAGDKRYDTHELLRQFATQQLALAGMLPALQHLHGTYYLTFLQRCEAKMAGSQQREIIAQLEADFENIRAAWLWAVEAHEYTLVNQALNALFHWFFWLRRSRQEEGLALLQLVLQSWGATMAATEHPVWGRLQARLLKQQGPWFDEPVATRERIQQALTLARRHEDAAEIYFCTWALGLALVSEGGMLTTPGDSARAIHCFEECLVAYRALGDHFWLGQTLEKLGHTYRRVDLCDLAVPLLEESLTLRRMSGDRFGEARSLRELAWARFNQGMERATLETAQAAYELQMELDDQQGIADSRFFLALACLAGGDWPRAQMLLDPVRQYAAEMNVALYRRWASISLLIAAAMQENMQRHHLISCSFPNRFCAFTTRLYYLLFSIHATEATSQTANFRRNLQKLLTLATTSSDFALCILFVAHYLAYTDETHRAIMLLALALRDPIVAQSWITHLPVIGKLQTEVRHRLPPAEFASAWEHGEGLSLRPIATELQQELDDGSDELVPG